MVLTVGDFSQWADAFWRVEDSGRGGFQKKPLMGLPSNSSLSGISAGRMKTGTPAKVVGRRVSISR